jgi:hypothetical protein
MAQKSRRSKEEQLFRFRRRRQKMAYIVKTKPNGFVVCRTETEREARIIISAMESNDVQEDRFEPDTYYIEEAMG